MALNNGQYVDLLLDRIAAPYFDVQDFDDLPTRFRAVAVDLLTAQTVVLGRGFLAEAMRATMSLPIIFPPVEVDGRLLIDGGTMNNVPADVAKAMGANRVVAVNVGDLSDRGGVDPTMFGIAGSTLDAMMRASTRRAIALADVVINVPLTEYGSLEWQRAPDLIEAGYRAAEAMRDQLLPLAVSELEFEAWRADRQAHRRTNLPAPTFLQLEGFATTDEKRLNTLMARHVGVPLDFNTLEHDLAVVTGLDRYEAITWRMVDDGARGYGLRVQGRLKTYAPPFLMLGLNIENTTSSDFRMTAAARYLAFDTVGSGSELRVDGAAGSDPAFGVQLYRPIASTPFFVAPYAGVGRTTFNFVDNGGDAVVARYLRTRTRLGLDAGVNLGPRSDVRAGAYVGHTAASITVGDPGLPGLSGTETGAEMVWRLNTQDSLVVPSHGVLSEVRVSHIFDGPSMVVQDRTLDAESSLTQLSAEANQFWSAGPRNRVFVYGGVGTSFDRTPFPSDQFALGMPFRLGAYKAGELRGNHYYIATGGYLRRVAGLPGFIGGPVFAGAWLENGDVFDDWQHAGFRSNGGSGIVLDTRFGPVILGGSWSFDGRWRTYFAVGRLFR
jgi:NTE family protein